MIQLEGSHRNPPINVLYGVLPGRLLSNSFGKNDTSWQRSVQSDPYSYE